MHETDQDDQKESQEKNISVSAYFVNRMVTGIDRSAEIITLADDLMYEAKKSGKSSVQRAVFADKM